VIDGNTDETSIKYIFHTLCKKLTNCTSTVPYFSDELRSNAEIKIISSPLSEHVDNFENK
jgi:hypothetical protein